MYYLQVRAHPPAKITIVATVVVYRDLIYATTAVDSENVESVVVIFNITALKARIKTSVG